MIRVRNLQFIDYFGVSPKGFLTFSWEPSSSQPGTIYKSSKENLPQWFTTCTDSPRSLLVCGDGLYACSEAPAPKLRPPPKIELETLGLSFVVVVSRGDSTAVTKSAPAELSSCTISTLLAGFWGVCANGVKKPLPAWVFLGWKTENGCSFSHLTPTVRGLQCSTAQYCIDLSTVLHYTGLSIVPS